VKEHALKYLEMGFNVIPVKRDKKPLLMSWAEYQEKRVTVPLVEKWWDTWPDANIGIVTGPISDAYVIDADSEKGLLALDPHLNGAKPTVKTPNGWHYYFRDPGNKLGNTTRFLEECDSRGYGGYVVAPPSVNEEGKKYDLLESLDALEALPPAMLSLLLSSSRNSYIQGTGQNVTNLSHNVTSCHILFRDGTRDEDLFHTANSLVKGGMDTENVKQVIEILARICDPPFPEKEINIKVQSALKRNETKKNTLAGLIREYIMLQTGHISVTDCYVLSHSVTSQDKSAVRTSLHRFEKEGLLERTGKRAGEYRIVEAEAEPIDWKNAKEDWARLYLPWKLTDFIDIPEGGIILLMGDPGAGKTAAQINIARYNMRKKWNVHYLSTEASEGSFRKRAEAYKDLTLDDWNVNFYYDPPIIDTIKPGKGNLWLIDYLEIYDSFWEIGKTLADIYRKLGGGVAVCAIQKQPNSDIALGGQFTQFKPCLTLALEWQKIKIIKARDVKESHIEKYGSPKGKEYHFKMVDNRTKYIEERWWTHPFKEK